jgi:hypothetical protein
VVLPDRARAPQPTPSPWAGLKSAPPRLALWLWLANNARGERNDAAALRTYFLILEDLDDGSDSRVRGIACARDFVSHGRVDRARVRAFLQSELGYAAPSYQYDPHDHAHQKLASKYRHLARRLVEKALQPYAGPHWYRLPD